MRRRTVAILPVLLATVWLLSLFAPVLRPGRALANRDVPIFHLPLRTAFRQLAASGLPLWNPWLHGGQPVASNPSYSTFYPPAWLAVALPPVAALGWLTALHAALAFAGAWRLARRLGCGRGAAAMAGIGFAGSGAYLSFLSAWNLFVGISWLPWVLAWGDEALQAPAGERWWRPALLAGGALAMTLLNGEPATAMMAGLGFLALAAVALVRGRRPRRTLARALLPLAAAVVLAAVQLVPAAGRLASSPRRGLGFAAATVWSLPPARLVEVAFPRFYGDPAGDVEGRFAGWRLNDRHYPYVESLYPGLLLAVLGAAALLRRGVPRRGAWALAAAGGLFLALGRHNPFYAGLRRIVPPLAVLRYPEKFAVLAVLALGVAGVLGWQRLLDERRAGRPEAARLPLALAGLALAAALAVALALRLSPGAVAWVGSQIDPALDPGLRGAALDALRGESLGAVATAGAVTALLALCRWGRLPQPALQVLALGLLAADLWRHGHGLVRSAPAALFREPPPLAAALLPARGRIFVQPQPAGAVELVAREGDEGDPELAETRAQLARLQPFSGVLWGLPSIFEVDFDLTLTRWGQRAEALFRSEASRTGRAWRYLGAWNVTDALLRPPPGPPGVAGAPLRRVPNPFALPRFRFVPRVRFHAGHDEAAAAAAAAGWRVARQEEAVGEPGRTLAYSRPPRALGLDEEGGRIRVDYRAEEGAFLVVATTYDEGWRARLDDGGGSLPVHPTAACQLGVELPPGEHRLRLDYREPLLAPGAAVSLLGLAAAALLYRRPRPRFWEVRP